MLRVSAAAALTLAGLLAPLPLLAGVRVEERKEAIAPNALGTWRLDSLLDQAVVNGIEPGDVDPATYVLHDLRFDDGSTGIVPAKTPFGETSVEQVDGAARLKVKGKAGFFRLKIPKSKISDIGAIACRVRSKEFGEVVVVRDPAQIALIEQLGGPPEGVAPAPAGPVLPFIPGIGNVQLPQQGGPQRFMGPGGMPPDFDPRILFGGDVVKFAADGEWHNIVRRNGPSSRNLGMFGGQAPAQRSATLEEIAIIVLPPVAAPPAATEAAAAEPAVADPAVTAPDSPAGVKPVATTAPAGAPAAEPEGVLDLEFVHLLDSKADYAGATAAPVQLARRSVLHSGLHLNTPSSLTWRLVAPQGGKLIAGLGALNDRPFDCYVHVTSAKGRETLFRHTFAPPLDPDAPFDQEAIAPIAVDLAPFGGQEIAIEIEVVEEGDPNVAFLLQPLIHGKRQGDGPRNVMLYFCDTLRADALSSYGNSRATTPTLDALAASGIRFERCFSQGAWTYVSMPSSLSSLFPSVNGVRSGGEQIPGSATTVAEAFREAGYLTAAFIRNDFVGPTTRTEQGFDFFFPGDVIGAPNANALNLARDRAFGRRPNPADADAGAGGMNFSSGSSRDLYAKVEPWLDQYRDIPFFLYLHAVDPHDPYDPDAADRAKFLSEEEHKAYLAMETKVNAAQQQMMQMGNMAFGGGNVVIAGGGAAAPTATPAAPADGANGAGDGEKAAPAANDAATTATAPPPPPTGAPPVVAAPPVAPPARGAGVNPGGSTRAMYTSAGVDPDDFMRKQRAIYDAEVHYFDRHYRQLRDYFAQHGLTDRTLFSFNADHGEEFLDHGATGHGQSVYAELNHVPWILAAPGLLPEGKVVPDNVANVDLGPTLLGLVGVTPPDTMQGRNLAAELQSGDELPAMMIVTERWGGGMFGGAGPSAGGDGDYLGEWAVMEGRWKTIVRRSMEAKPGADGKPGAPELKIDLEIYDLLADMTDSKSLIESERPRAEAASKRLEIWLGEMRKLAAARYSGDDTQSDGALDMMRALGYAQ